MLVIIVIDHNKHTPPSYLTDVFNIKFDIEGQFDILLREDSLFGAAVPAQTTEGASVAGPLFIRSETTEEMQSFCSACFPFKVCSHAKFILSDRNSMMGVKSMVTRAGSPGMSGMMDVSLKRILVPVTTMHRYEASGLIAASP